jgi:organic radical activating enzyme
MNNKRITEIKYKLNNISPTFCTLPWLHSSIYMHNGTTHSCCHPPLHDIDKEKIQTNPSSLHNTERKRMLRRDILLGVQNSDCNFCWNIENAGKISDRVLWNGTRYAYENIEQVSTLDPNEDINPKYLILSFGNTCNLRCGYCGPMFSSKWTDEITEYGSYDILEAGHYDATHYTYEDDNPYVEAFWKWWPTLKDDLYTLKITGGEPFLNNRTIKLFSLFENDPAPNLIISINTNFNVSTNRMNKFFSQVSRLKKESKIKDFTLFASLDTWGKPAEYIRQNLDLELWERNFIQAQEFGIQTNIIMTVNILSITSMKKLLQKIVEWRKKYYFDCVRFNAPILDSPRFWSVKNLTNDFYRYIDDVIAYVNDNKDMFRDDEQEIIARFKDIKFDNTANNIDFYKFIQESDKRTNNKFLSIFPEYTNYFNMCRAAYDNS